MVSIGVSNGYHFGTRWLERIQKVSRPVVMPKGNEVMGDGKRYEVVPYPRTEGNLSLEEQELWLDKAFAPLIGLLDAEYSDQKEHILSRLMFMGHGGENKTDFIYKNSLTREYILISSSGEVLRQDVGVFL